MSLADPLDLSYSGVTKSLPRINQDNFGATYSAEDADGSKRYTFNVKHTIPKRGAPLESHLVRLDVEHRDAGGEYTHTASAWLVIKTFDGEQVSQDADYAARTISNFISGASWANLAKLVARES